MLVRAGVVVHDDLNTNDGRVVVRVHKTRHLKFGINNQNALEE